jgi:uncharacterized membrane protein
MRKHFKYLLGLLAVIAILALTMPCAAEVAVINTGATNMVAKNATTTDNLGSGTKIDRSDNVSIEMRGAGAAAGTSTVTYNWRRSLDGGTTYETTPGFSTAFAQNGLVAVVAVTNMPQSIIGAATHIKLVSIVHGGDTGNLTNASVRVAIKSGVSTYK